MTIQNTLAPTVGMTGSADHHLHLHRKAALASTAAAASNPGAAPGAAPGISVTLPGFAASLLSALGVTGSGQTGAVKGLTTLHL